MGEPKDDVLSLLEEFFSQPAFTTAVSDFAAQHATRLSVKSVSEEQPLDAHAMFQEYTTMIEQLVTDFLAEAGLTPAEFVQAVQNADPRVNSCVDYLLASTEYPAFLQLMSDFSSMSQFDAAVDEYATVDSGSAQ